MGTDLNGDGIIDESERTVKNESDSTGSGSDSGTGSGSDDDSEIPEKYICYNCDDDDRDVKPDREDDDGVPHTEDDDVTVKEQGDDDLAEVVLMSESAQFLPADCRIMIGLADSSGTFIDTPQSDADSVIKVWKSKNRSPGSEIVLPATFYNIGDVPTSVWVEGYNTGRTLFCLRAVCGDDVLCEIKIKFTVIETDLDTDSDNADGPELSDEEDRIENAPSEFGKIISVHVPGEPYTPLVLQLPEPLVINTAVIRLDYKDELIQIWKEDSSSGTNKPFSPGEYNAADLGFGPGKRNITLYLQGIRPGDDFTELIKVETDPN